MEYNIFENMCDLLTLQSEEPDPRSVLVSKSWITALKKVTENLRKQLEKKIGGNNGEI
jgi:hypothetical protein